VQKVAQLYEKHTENNKKLNELNRFGQSCDFLIYYNIGTGRYWRSREI
jgi:hypothetical protein